VEVKKLQDARPGNENGKSEWLGKEISGCSRKPRDIVLYLSQDTRRESNFV